MPPQSSLPPPDATDLSRVTLAGEAKLLEDGCLGPPVGHKPKFTHHRPTDEWIDFREPEYLGYRNLDARLR